MADADQGGGGTQNDPANDPKHRAKSKDPGWNYAFWPDLGNKDVVQCKLCDRKIHLGIKRMKQHLAGGYGDTQKCPKTTTAITREMQDYLKKTARNKTPILYDEDEEEQRQGHEADEEGVEVEVEQPAARGASSKGSCFQSSSTPSPTPSSGTALKRKLAAAMVQSKKLALLPW